MRFAELAARWQDRPVLVVGDAVLDCWLTGTPTRMSREAPVPVITLETTREVAGGAAAVAGAFTGLGARTTVVGVTGDDDAGATLRSRVWDGGATDRLVVAVGRRTLTKRRVVAAGQVVARFDDGDTSPLTGGAAETLLHRLGESLAERPAAVVVCDLGAGTLGPAVRALLASRRLDVPLLAVDALDLAPWAHLGPDLVTPTLDTVGGVVDGTTTAAVIASRGMLLRSTAAAVVAVTLDADGAVVHSHDADTVHTSAAPTPRNRSAYVAGFILAQLAGAALPEAAATAQRCAAIRDRDLPFAAAQLGSLDPTPA
ncbi:PfkB family carbohydrate kinase [Dactylosporangium sp. CA-152071]|uniref:PfkB family carbohydrate kinase n=1 Tax=Dactylosporangium sp. CA-152071 TaxID=3239933 RepID=UPI003D8D54FE